MCRFPKVTREKSRESREKSMENARMRQNNNKLGDSHHQTFSAKNFFQERERERGRWREVLNFAREVMKMFVMI